MKTYSIVGMNWRKTEDIVAALKVGTPVVLVREPKNPVDPRAVAVYAEGILVGYVPKKQNAALAQFIDQMGSDWTPPPSGRMAEDEAPKAEKAITAKFVRSPNSGYPMVEVSG